MGIRWNVAFQTMESTRGVTGYLEVTVNDKLVHSKKVRMSESLVDSGCSPRRGRTVVYGLRERIVDRTERSKHFLIICFFRMATDTSIPTPSTKRSLTPLPPP